MARRNPLGGDSVGRHLRPHIKRSVLSLLWTTVSFNFASAYVPQASLRSVSTRQRGPPFFSLDSRGALRLQVGRVGSDWPHVDGEEDNDVQSETLSSLKISQGRPEPALEDRRKVLTTLSAVATTVFLCSSGTPANAYDKQDFPIELNAIDEEYDGRQQKVNKVMESEFLRVSPLSVGPGTMPLGSFLWGSALWLFSGSRSTPIATPLANVLYDENIASWLKDRNNGLFADFPFPFYIILAVVFAIAGFGMDTLVTTLGEGDRNISLQLAGVSLITSGSLDLGRIASGEKKMTRNESDRSSQLEQEFTVFASDRLKPGGNCHRVDVIRAFRRYYAKYRQPDDPDYPLTNLEIEQLLRNWSESLNNVDMRSTGFYYGIQVNAQADVFTSRY